MRISFIILVLLHGLIHLLGFVKGFNLKDLKELTTPISKSMGILWLTSAILLLFYGMTYWFNFKYSWSIGFIAVIISQILIITLWKDARFGTIPNLIILLVAVISMGNFNFQMLVRKETENLLNNTDLQNLPILTEEKIKNLPEPVKLWLQNSGAVGKRITQVARITQNADLKMKPEQNEWIHASAFHYSFANPPAFVWQVKAQMNKLLFFVGRDKYDKRKGEMLIKLNSLINVVKERGEKLDEGSLQRYLGEIVWLPSLAISPYITWQSVNDSIATATLKYNDIHVSGTFHFSGKGDVIKYVAWRYKGNEYHSLKYEWTMKIDDYRIFDGIKVPSNMTATWKLEEGDWTWLRLEVTDIRYNENAIH